MVTAEITRELLSKHGKTRSQPATDWTGKIPLPPAVEKFYLDIGPSNITIEAHGNPYFLPNLASLWKFQAGYRWHGLTKERIEVWKDEWLVVADEGGDPFFFDQSSSTVLHAYHGAGKWDAREMFPDLNTMAACLAQLGGIVCEFRDEYMAEDCSIRPKFRAIALERFQKLLGTTTDAKAILDVLCWG